MKTLIALLFALSLYLLPYPTHSTFNPLRLRTADVAAASGDTPVLDTDGNEVRVGETYYITSLGGPPSIGVQLAWLNSTTQCASNVVIFSRCLLDGDPIRITPADPTATVISQSTFQSFSFFVSTSPPCASSVYWGIMHDPRYDLYFLNSGEFVPNLSDRFKIEADPDHPNGYRIGYCPFGEDKCYYVGGYIIPSDGAVRVGLTLDYAIPFVFKRATSCNDLFNITDVSQGVGSLAEKFRLSVL